MEVNVRGEVFLTQARVRTSSGWQRMVERSARARLASVCAERRESLADGLRNDPRYQKLRKPSPAQVKQMRQRSREALPVLRELARELVAAPGSPYDVARSMWQTAMSAVSPSGPEGAQCKALWLLWGALTDWVERKPNERQAAEDAMRRAAREWLAVVDDEAAWRAYFDRWLYEELGYPRPDGRAS